MNLFELFAKISLDTSEYEEGLDDASNKAGGFADKLKSGLGTAAKVGAAGLAAAATGIAAITKNAIQNYAQYEQLVGGVETLFKDNADAVLQYADNAYKTAGLSANAYMETVTSFSASLLQSLDGDTQAAAEYADMAITDMADNANKMGTSMESIQNAYQGFAKQNYTMLDNLKLGYGGTKEEMERLLQDADALSESFNLQTDASGNLVYSYADIVDAIHIVQTEMGITGTTAAEASSTIAGSVDSMKSAWTNLVTGLGDANADIDVLLDNFLGSVETVGKNLIPAIGRILSGLFSAIEERGPDMLAEGILLLGKLAVGLIEGIPTLIAKIPQIIRKIVSAFTERASEFRQIGKDIVNGLWNGILSMASWIKEKVSGFFSGIVNGVKNLLGINSPSKVFAEIGVDSARGVGVGWDSKYGDIKKSIERDMEDTTKSVEFEMSGIGKSSSRISSAIAGTVSSFEENATIVVQSILDGRIIGEASYNYAKNKQRAMGVL